MLSMTDVNALVERLPQDVPSMQDVPAWASRKGMDDEIVENVIASACARVSMATGFMPDVDNLGDTDQQELVATLMQLFIVGVELGRMPVTQAADLPDLNNITSEDDDR
jgi:hypothetical protein